MVRHEITAYLQPSRASCGPTALAMVLSAFDKNVTPETVLSNIPVNLDQSGEEIGTLSQELATWCVDSGYKVDLYAFDFQILDFAWRDMASSEVIDRLKTVEATRNAPGLGNVWSQRYVRSYIDFVKNGGNLRIMRYPTQELLCSLLNEAPLFVNVTSHVLYGFGRLRYGDGLREETPDDVDGVISTHSIAVLGYEDATFFVMDPWEGEKKVESDALLAAIMSASIECDAMLFQVNRM